MAKSDMGKSAGKELQRAKKTRRSLTRKRRAWLESLNPEVKYTHAQLFELATTTLFKHETLMRQWFGKMVKEGRAVKTTAGFMIRPMAIKVMAEPPTATKPEPIVLKTETQDPGTESVISDQDIEQARDELVLVFNSAKEQLEIAELQERSAFFRRFTRSAIGAFLANEATQPKATIDRRPDKRVKLTTIGVKRQQLIKVTETLPLESTKIMEQKPTETTGKYIFGRDLQRAHEFIGMIFKLAGSVEVAMTRGVAVIDMIEPLIDLGWPDTSPISRAANMGRRMVSLANHFPEWVGCTQVATGPGEKQYNNWYYVKPAGMEALGQEIKSAPEQDQSQYAGVLEKLTDNFKPGQNFTLEEAADWLEVSAKNGICRTLLRLANQGFLVLMSGKDRESYVFCLPSKAEKAKSQGETIDALKQEVAQSHAELAKLRQERDSLLEDKKKLETELLDLATKLRQLEESFENKNAQPVTAQNRYKLLEADRDELRKKLAEALARAEKAEDSHNRLLEKFTISEISELGRLVDEANDAVTQAEYRVQELEQQLTDSQYELGLSRTQLTQAQKQITTAKNQVAELEARIDQQVDKHRDEPETQENNLAKRLLVLEVAVKKQRAMLRSHRQKISKEIAGLYDLIYESLDLDPDDEAENQI